MVCNSEFPGDAHAGTTLCKPLDGERSGGFMVESKL